MITDFHFLRPWWLLALLLLLGLAWRFAQSVSSSKSWEAICDSQLLEQLLKRKDKKTTSRMWCIWLSGVFMIFSAAGPAWKQLPIPTYKVLQPRVIVLDLSDHMKATDLMPNRLARAKFKLHDLFSKKDIGQLGLIVFTGEPFVVSPLTDDGQTIQALLPVLTNDIMPVGGQDLNAALNEAHQLIQQAGYQQGQILVLTADPPSEKAIETAKEFGKTGIRISILPMRANGGNDSVFQRFSEAGQGQMIQYTMDDSDINKWLMSKNINQSFALSSEENIPLWNDEGRWFLIPGLLLLLPLFQRRWLQRIGL